MTLTVGSLFSGYGGLDMAVEAVLGARTAWHCENNPDAARILARHHPDTPNLDDISAVDWASVEPVDVLCGGFPCQDISSAGRGAGIKEGTRSGLWHRYADAVRVLRPSLVVVENVSALLVRGFGIVAGDLAALGYVGSWVSVRASDVGAPHRRERIFILAWPASDTGGGGRFGWEACDEPAVGGRDGVPTVGREGVSVAAGSDRPDAVALLPTPSASNPNDGEDLGGWAARRERVKESANNSNGFGVPLSIAVRLLPTPTTEPSTGNGHARNLGTELSLLPTPTAMDAAGSRGHRPDGTPYTPTSGVTLTDATTDANRWGQYAPAIDRWEHTLGRTAPAPTDERNRLSAPFPEWMMGLPAGWVTSLDIGLSRSAQLRAIGNGVVPQQAAHALRLLLTIRERELLEAVS